MRRILASAMLALILAGGIMTVVASLQAQAKPHFVNCNSDLGEDNPADPC
jgi:hypothetical protein